MSKRIVSGIMFTLLLVGTLAFAFNIQPVRSDWAWTETIRIKVDGSVEPATAPISSDDNITYTFTDNIVGDVPEGDFAIVVQRHNIIIDGGGHKLQGIGAPMSTGISCGLNVTIKNLEIKSFAYGIKILGPNNTISGNNITDNHNGIMLDVAASNYISGNNITNNWRGIFIYRSPNNTISGNNITNNYYGITLDQNSNNSIITGNIIAANTNCGISLTISSDNNTIYHNSIIDNPLNAYIIQSTNNWDNGCEGNYWSDYDGEDLDEDGIGDTPHIIDENNTDNFPLMSPYLYADVNHDAVVNMRDINLCCDAFCSYPEQPNWNCHCDINEDGTVNMRDISTACDNFMETWP